MATALKIPDGMAVDAFLAWDAPMGQLWQLIDGVPQAMAPASPIHGQIQGEVAALIRNHLIAKGGPCFVVVTPGVIPRVQSDINMRNPDLAVTCTPALPTDKALREPVLLIEILSPNNRAETWSNGCTKRPLAGRTHCSGSPPVKLTSSQRGPVHARHRPTCSPVAHRHSRPCR